MSWEDKLPTADEVTAENRAISEKNKTNVDKSTTENTSVDKETAEKRRSKRKSDKNNKTETDTLFDRLVDKRPTDKVTTENRALSGKNKTNVDKSIAEKTSINKTTADKLKTRRKSETNDKTESDSSFGRLVDKSAFAEAKIIAGVSTKSSISMTGLDNIWDCAVTDNLPEDTKHFYDLWANNYEEDMRSMQYRAPEILAEYMINTLRIDRNAKILDAGCGTGLLGEELKKRGFIHMDGLDCSHCMLDLAMSKSVYKKTEVVHVLPSMTDPPIRVDYRYECIALCDAFQPGHITPGCLPKLAALLTDKGVIAFCQRKLSPDNLSKSVFGPADFAAAVAASGVTLKESKEVDGYRKIPPTKAELGYFAK